MVSPNRPLMAVRREIERVESFSGPSAIYSLNFTQTLSTNDTLLVRMPFVDLYSPMSRGSSSQVLTPSSIPTHTHAGRIYHRKHHLVSIIALMLLHTRITPGIIGRSGYISRRFATRGTEYRARLIPGEYFDRL